MIQQLLRHGLWLSCLVWVTSAFGQSPADASAPAESLAHSGPAEVVASPADSSAARVFVDTTDVQILHATSQRIRDLLGDTLQAEVIPADLFDLPLDDDAAIRVEVERLGAVLGEQGPVPGGRPATHARDGETHSQQGDTPDSLQAGADSLLLAARLDLDRARLDFYSLPKARRDSLVQKQTQRWRETAGARQAAELDQAEKRQRDALAERQRSIEDAAHARTEAERLINEEQARLLGIQAEQASVSADMLRARQALALGGELSLSYHRRIRELQDAGQIADSADGLYDELRQHLRTSRDQLARAISMVAAPSVVPTAGEDPLGSLMSGVDRTAIDRIRLEIDATSVQLRLRERRLRLDQAGQLYDDVRALNADRLKLLGFLSSERRGRIIHFGADGLDQALAEVRQVSLVLSYHLMVSRNWITTLGSSSSTLGWSAVTFGMVLLKWIFTLGLFLWWRKRGDELLQQWRERIREEDRRQRAVVPSRLIIVLDSLRQIRGPLDWLLLVILLVWALPTETAAQLEVRLLATVLFWAFGGALAVDVINTIASHQEQTRPLGALSPHGTLRLRSLRLVGRTVVVFGLILVLSIQLVGRGTIYNWVFSICWFAAIPVALVILRWWRVVILERIDANRKKRPLERWVLQNRSGWKSFPAVAAGGVYLFTRGALRILRNRVSRFNLTRRTLAWLFRRGMDRLADEKSGLQFAELPASVFSIMGPEHQSANDVSGEGDAQVQRVLERIRRTGGGVFAVVGERGGGKSAVLHRVQELHPDTLLLDCPVTGP
ncbi:MAG: hypothetical protein KDC10_06075, partial [Calditrichaeota bacterium]|nr:hypothetical protein [Calditrichota bacterium]